MGKLRGASFAPEQPLPQNNHELFQALATLLDQQPRLIILDGFERELRMAEWEPPIWEMAIHRRFLSMIGHAIASAH